MQRAKCHLIVQSASWMASELYLGTELSIARPTSSVDVGWAREADAPSGNDVSQTASAMLVLTLVVRILYQNATSH